MNHLKTFSLTQPHIGHLLDALPSNKVECTKDELMRYLTQMLRIRRMEMSADALYKGKQIRGFCHLSIGQVGGRFLLGSHSRRH